MLRSIALIVYSLHLFSGDIISQNLFVDPGFDEPIPKPNSITECQYYKGETFDDASSVWHRSNDGTPDILLPREEECPKHMNKKFFTSQYLGLYFGSVNKVGRYYSEPVETKLKTTLSSLKAYQLSFDILFNDMPDSRAPDMTPYKSRHVNIVLKSSLSSKADTIIVPVSAKSHKEWDRTSVVFVAKEEFDIVQFDYISDMFKSSDKQLRLYAYLDNFELIETDKEPTKFLGLDSSFSKEFESVQFSYFYKNDNDQLVASEIDKLNSDIQNLSLQKIAKISVTGYTDNNHNEEYNSILSNARAENIISEIKQNLIGSDIIYDSQGLGIDYSQSDKAKSRRVDVSISYVDDEIAPWYQTSNNTQYFINYSFLGNKRLAQQKNNISNILEFKKGVKTKFSKLPFDANRMIIQKAKKAKIIIINEAHTAPSHRAFIANLLPGLKKIGYTNLAIEALQNADEVQSLTIKDPTFVRYLKEAKRLNYRLLSYDNKSIAEPDWKMDIKSTEGIEYSPGYENISHEMNIRDYNQFLNLESEIDMLKDHEKIIIHVGHGHGITRQNGDWKPLGAYLVEKYGSVSVLSIDQVSLNNCMFLDSNAYYNQYKPKRSIVCNVENKPFVEKNYNPLSGRLETMYDIQVLHPSRDISLKHDTSYMYVDHRGFENANYPLSVMVYELKDNPRSDVAYSAIEVKHNEDWKRSIIPNRGGYKFLVKDSNNNVVAYDTVEK